MRISDWSSDVCSSDLLFPVLHLIPGRGKITPYRDAEVRSQFGGIADITIGPGTFHPAHIGKWIGDDTYVFRHLYPLLENAVTLILKKVDDKIQLIVK